MTSKETKIKEAYISAGVDWEQVKEFIDENGRCKMYDSFGTKLNSNFQEMGFSREDVENKFDSGCNSKSELTYRPKSLSGIETNNGWITIESEKDLPSEVDKYWVIGYGLDYPIIQFFDVENKNEWLEVVTHYQPIIKPKPPIY